MNNQNGQETPKPEEQTADPAPEMHEEEQPEEMPSETAPSQETPSSAQNELPRGLLAQVKRIGAPIPRKYDELKTFIIECKRVLRVTKKPSRDEFKTIVKISAVGMAAIGLLGFVIFAAKELLF